MLGVLCVGPFEYFWWSTCNLQAASLTWLAYFDHTIPQTTATDGRVISTRRKHPQSLLNYYSGNCMEGLRYTIKIFSETCWSPGHEMHYFHSPKADCSLFYCSMWSLWLTLIYHLHHKLLFFSQGLVISFSIFKPKWYWQPLDYTNSYF